MRGAVIDSRKRVQQEFALSLERVLWRMIVRLRRSSVVPRDRNVSKYDKKVALY